MRRPALASVFLLCAAPALAEGADESYFVSSEGHQYALACNADGYSLTSRHPVARFVENGAASTVETGLETLYFGRSCDAQGKVLGRGKWCWANGGFSVEFEGGRSIGFPRQELSCEDQSLDIDGCGC
jgi:hypothetical protein